MLQYEFHAYGPDGAAIHPEITTAQLGGDGAAKAKAGRLAKLTGGPVDLARAGGAEWADRYMTTASPSKFHQSGYRFERLDG